MKNLRPFFAVVLREAGAYVDSPIAYIFIAAFVGLTAGYFMNDFFLRGLADMRGFFNLLPMVLPVFIPAVTMRLWAEDKKGGTFEFLLTLPVEPWKLVLGKFLAGAVFYAVALAGTLLIPVMLMSVGKPDLGPVIGGYLGAVLLGMFFLSLGIFISGLCREQIVAFILSMAACYFFYLAGLNIVAGPLDGWIPGLGTFLKMNFGLLRHWDSFVKGVVDAKDVLYFLVMTALFLTLNALTIGERMRPKVRAVFMAMVAVCLVMGLAFNVLLANVPLGRIDLTEGRLYEVTRSTKEILKGLAAPVRVTVYLSPAEKMPTAFKTLEQGLRDRLEELRLAVPGTLTYEVVPVTAARVEGWGALPPEIQALEDKGIKPFQVQNIDRDGMGIRLIYAALAIGYQDKPEEVIPRIVPASLPDLEYDLMSKIYKLTMEKQPRVALFAPYTDKPVPDHLIKVFQELKQLPREYRADRFRLVESALRENNYEVWRIRLNAQQPLPANLNTLVVMAPEDLNPRQRYEIARFLAGGGNVIVAAQQNEFNYQEAGQRGFHLLPQPTRADLNALLGPYGVQISKDFLMDERFNTVTMTGKNSLGPGSISIPVQAPIQIRVEQDSMNRQSVITERLSPIFYMWGSALDVNEGVIRTLGLKETLLLSSGPRSWMVPFHPGSLTRDDLKKTMVPYRPHLPLALLLEGQFPDVSGGQPAPAWTPDMTPYTFPPWTAPGAEKEPVPEYALRPGKLAVIGNAKMFEEDFIKAGGSMDFLMNLMDTMTLGDDLIRIRTHKPVSRAIRAVTDAEKAGFRVLTIFLIPVLVVALGLVRAFLRRKQKADYLRSLENPARASDG